MTVKDFLVKTLVEMCWLSQEQAESVVAAVEADPDSPLKRSHLRMSEDLRTFRGYAIEQLLQDITYRECLKWLRVNDPEHVSVRILSTLLEV